MLNNFIVIIVGPSGVGKTTICKNLVKKLGNAVYSVSVTTRKRRKNEIEGKDYHFITKEKFDELRNEGKLFEWTKIYDNFYGTLKEEIEKLVSENYNVIMALDINGVRAFKKIYKNVISIFIMPPSYKEIKNRMKNRNGKLHLKRYKEIENEIKWAKECDYIVINENLNKTMEEICCIIKGYGK